MGAPNLALDSWPRPPLVVSACLGFAAVRYSGEPIPDRTVAPLRGHVDFLPVCPEAVIGPGYVEVQALLEPYPRALVDPKSS